MTRNLPSRLSGWLSKADLIVSGFLGIDDDRCNPREGMDRAPIPGNLNIARPGVGYLHHVGSRIVDSDLQHSTALNGDPTMLEGRGDIDVNLQVATLVRRGG
jgi:hypothetical protein